MPRRPHPMGQVLTCAAERTFVLALLLALLAGTPNIAASPADAATARCPSGLIALTFDDGPGPHTPGVLDVLAAANVPGTFFVLGSLVERRPEMVLRTARAGHEVGNHTYSHPELTRLSSDAIRREVQRTDRAIRATGVSPLLLLRPPYGAWDGPGGRVERAAGSVGYRIVTWNVDPTDYRATSEQIRSRVRANLRPGAIVLLHDGTSNAPQMITALPGILRDARDRGYCFGVLDDRGRVVARHLGVFIDIHGTTHQASIEQLAATGLVAGCNPPVGTRFCPQDPVTRAQFATILVGAMAARGIDLAPATGPVPRFTDVAADGTHAAAINQLAAAGITRGCNPPDNDRFCPNRHLTRAQLATFLVAALSLEPEPPEAPEPPEPSEPPEPEDPDGTGSDPSDPDGSEAATSDPATWRFTDVPPDATHARSIELLADSGITQGCGGSNSSQYCPEERLPRGQLASFVVRGVLAR